MRVLLPTVLAIGLLLAARSTEPAATQSQPTAPQELLARPYLYDLVRHLYRWYLDERDLDPLTDCREFVFWVRALQPKLDENDRSRFGEIFLPQLGVRVKVKLADYTIAELDTTVKSDTFKIVAVARVPCDDPLPPESTEVKVNFAEMRDELYRTRRKARFPEGELLERLRRATRNELLKDIDRRARKIPVGPNPVRHSTCLSHAENTRILNTILTCALRRPRASSTPWVCRDANASRKTNCTASSTSSCSRRSWSGCTRMPASATGRGIAFCITISTQP